MPLVNLIWEQRLVRRKYQRIVSVMLAVIGLGVLTMGEEVVRTGIKRRDCEKGIAVCEERIRVSKPLADRNAQVLGEIAALEPTLGLLQEAQRGTLRWVALLNELDRSIPDPRVVALSQLSFTTTPTTAAASNAAAVSKDIIGNLMLSGVSKTYESLAQTMRNLGSQPHVQSVRLTQGQAEVTTGVVRFSMQAKFRIPEDETKALPMGVAVAKAPGTDPAELLQQAGQNTTLDRGTTAAQAAR